MAKRKSKTESNSPQNAHYIAIVAVVAVVAVIILVMNSMETSTPVEDMAMEEVYEDEVGEEQALVGQAGSNVQYCKGLGAGCPSGLTCRQGRSPKGNTWLGSSNWRCLKLLWKGAQCDNDYQCASKDCNSVGVCGDGGEYSTAMGDNTVASGDYSTAMGYGSVASGSTSTAMGYNTVASSYRTTAMGDNTEASGYGSTAMGYGSVASGKYSTAMGRHAVAGQKNTFAVGLTSTYGNKCETEAQGKFRACVSDMVIEIDGKEISVNKIAKALCKLGDADFSEFC